MPSKSATSSKKSTIPKAPAKGGSARRREYTQKDLEDAVAACDPRNPNRISITKAVQRFGVPKTTIRNRILGAINCSDAHKAEQTLSPEEETVLANYCKLRGYRGVPLGKQEIIKLATELCGRKVGTNWIYGFQRRHPELKFRWAQRGEAKRASGLNRTNVDAYFKDLEHIMATENILPKDIYNLDEKGLEQSGGDLRLRVLVDHAQREPKLHGEEGRQMATILKCISAGGFAIPPLLIHPGTEKDGEWIRDNPCNA
jgi:hypothetical protein